MDNFGTIPETLYWIAFDDVKRPHVYETNVHLDLVMPGSHEITKEQYLAFQKGEWEPKYEDYSPTLSDRGPNE